MASFSFYGNVLPTTVSSGLIDSVDCYFKDNVSWIAWSLHFWQRTGPYFFGREILRYFPFLPQKHLLSLALIVILIGPRLQIR